MGNVSQQSAPKEPLGSLAFRLGIVIIVIGILAIILFGLVFPDFDPINFIINILGLIVMVVLLGLAVKGVLSMINPKPFSPTEDFRTKVINVSRKAKPFNVKNLFLRGERMMTYAKWGKIVGVGFLPYLTALPVKKDGKAVYETDKDGNTIYDKVWNEAKKEFEDRPKPKLKIIQEKDGDTVFVVEKAPFPFNLFIAGVDLVRCNKRYHSDVIGDVFITDVNLVPFGEWLYPSKQWQNDITRIMKEQEIQAIITTYRNNLDLVSNVTQMSLGADPTFQKIMQARSEQLGTGFNQGSGGE